LDIVNHTTLGQRQKLNIKMEKYKSKLKNYKKRETKNYTPLQSFFLTGQANSTNIFQKTNFIFYN